ncbi:MAG: D-2-hydroxyacid dehydrogenase [Tissierellia bacterium]|nr:D-2-hydroxyacid dehydrogenase [Tissierellia bacterium]
MKIALFNLREDEKKSLEKWQKQNPDVEIVAYSETLTADNTHLAQGAQGVCMAVLSTVDEGVYEKLQAMGVKVMSQRSAGTDMYNWDKMRELGIMLINVPVYSPNAIGEYVITSALYFTRNFNQFLPAGKEHDFRWHLPVLSREMATLTAGVVGTGNIGRAVAKLFKGMGAKVIGYDVYENDAARELLDYVSLDELYERSDVITFHVPATEDNYHMVNEEAIAKMKDTAVLVNSARGSIVDTQAVLKALDEGKLKGVALDVYEHEFDLVKKDLRGQDLNDPIMDEILQRNDIIYTPHIAFYTETALDNLLGLALDESVNYLKTGDSKAIVNR